MSKKLFFRLIKLLLGLGVLLLLLHLVGYEGLRKLTTVSPLGLLACLLLTGGVTLVVTWRWRALTLGLLGKAAASDASRSRAGSFSSYYCSYMFSRGLGLLLPRDISECGSRFAWLVSAEKITPRQAAAAVFLDRLADLGVSLFFLLFALPFWFGWLDETATLLLLPLAAAAGLVATALLPPPMLLAAWTAMARIFSWLRRRIPRLSRFLECPESPPEGLDKALLLRACALSMLKFGLLMFRPMAVAAGFELEIPWTLLLLGVPLGQLAYILAITPGGLGIYELGWAGLLGYAGVQGPVIASFVVGQRLLITASLVALLLLSWLLRLWTRFGQRLENQ